MVAGFWGGGPRPGSPVVADGWNDGRGLGSWKNGALEALVRVQQQAQLARTEATGARNDRNCPFFPRGRNDPVQRLLPDASDARL